MRHNKGVDQRVRGKGAIGAWALRADVAGATGPWGRLAGAPLAAARDLARRVPHGQLARPQKSVIRTTAFRRRASELGHA